MAVPARRTSKMRKNTRRSHDALKQATTINCQNCGSVVLSHRACMKCKTYKGVSIYPTDITNPKSVSAKKTDNKTAALTEPAKTATKKPKAIA